jgi:DNA-binding NarL/FixJ family response regulator
MKRLRLLVADDHDYMRCSIVEMLCNDFQVVGAVCDGDELVQSATCLLPDVIVSDIHMPRMDGLTARHKLITQHRSIPFVFVSAMDRIVKFPLNDPLAALVYKGDMPAHLSKAVAAVFTGQPYLSPYYRE